MSRTAHCCCGALSAEAEGDPEVTVVCHCVECQRRTGSPFGVAVFFKAAAVGISGPFKIYERLSEAGRRLIFRFCPYCGAIVWWETERHPEKIAIALGAFAAPQFAPPARSVSERTRHSWVDLPRDVPARTASRDSAQLVK